MRGEGSFLFALSLWLGAFFRVGGEDWGQEVFRKLLVRSFVGGEGSFVT